MQKNYAAAHKPKRDEAKAKEVADLRRENHELRRTVKRLYKEVGKRVASQDDAAEVVEESPEVPEVVVASICSCMIIPVELVLNGNTYLVCPDCKARKRTS